MRLDALACGGAGALCGIVSGYVLRNGPLKSIQIFDSRRDLLTLALTSGLLAARYRGEIVRTRGKATCWAALRILALNVLLFSAVIAVVWGFSDPHGYRFDSDSPGMTLARPFVVASLGVFAGIVASPVLVPLALASHFAVRAVGRLTGVSPEAALA